MTIRAILVANDSEFFPVQRLPLAQALRNLGVQIEIALPDGPGLDRIRGDGFTVHLLPPIKTAKSSFRFCQLLWTLRTLYRTKRPDLVHHFTIKPVLAGSMAARLVSGISVVNAVTGLGSVFIGSSRKARMMRPIALALYRLASCHPKMMFIFQNPDDRTTVLKARAISSQKAEVIRGSGVDVEKYQPTALPKGVPTVLLACRLIKDKGVLEYVEAATRLRKNGVNARFLLAGIPDKGNPSAISEEFLNSLRGENYIEWVGWQEDIRSCISNCRIACLPSYREGLPQFLLQAAAMGRPAVATDVPGCREVVIHKYNGLLVPPKESRGLTDSLQTLIENPALCEEMGNRGALHVRQHFGINTVAEQTLQLYQRLTDL